MSLLTPSLQRCAAVRATMGDKIVEILYSNRVTSENKRINTPPPPLHSKLGCLLFSIGSSNSGTTLHGGDGGEKGLFSPFEVGKTSEGRFSALERSELILSPIVPLNGGRGEGGVDCLVLRSYPN